VGSRSRDQIKLTETCNRDKILGSSEPSWAFEPGLSILQTWFCCNLFV